VRRAGRETQGIVPWYKRVRPSWAAGIIALIVIIAGIVAFLASSQRYATPKNTLAKPAASADMPAASIQIEPAGAAPAAEISKLEVVTQQPEIRPAMSVAGQSSALADILGNPSLAGESGASFTNLFARWGADISMSPADLGCKVGNAHGFECLFQAGGWARLRRLDLPAILEVSLPDGQRRRVTIVGLGNDTAQLAIGSQEYAFPLSEVDKVWDGSFILLWKPPFVFRKLYPGVKGEDVAWVRNALAKLEGNTSVSEAPDYFDKDLRQKIERFQQAQSLAPDGVIGIETLVRLTCAVAEPEVPSIVQHTARGE